MADNEIRVVISGVASDLRAALDGAKGDLGGLKAAIKDVPNKIPIDVAAQTTVALARLRELRDMAKDVPKHVSIKADADTGVAAAKLRLLERQARDTEEAIARAQLGSTIGGAGGGGGAGLLSGGVPGLGPVAIGAAGLPLIAAGLGSITALAGSAGAALLGLGAVGTSTFAILGAGLGPVVALAGGLRDAVTLSETLKTQQDALTAAVQHFGAGSALAKSAQTALTKTMIDAAPATLSLAESFVKVHDALNNAEQQVLPQLAATVKPLLGLFVSLLPTLEQMAKIDLTGIAAGLKPLIDFLGSGAFKDQLLALSDVFAKIAGPLGQAFTNLLQAFLNIAVAAAPFVIQIADAFERWTQSFLDSVTPGQQLHDLIGGLVGQLHSWWDLATALGRLMVTVFSGGASEGQKLVGQLTQLLDKWNAWLNTSAGQAAMRQFFTDSGNLLRGVLDVLGPVVKLFSEIAVGLIPTMTTLLAPLASLLATISQWVNGLSKDLPPVLNALPGLAVAVGVLASWKALQTVVSDVASTVSGKISGKGVSAATDVVPAAGGAAVEEEGAGLRSKLLTGLGIAGIGTLIATQIGSSIHGALGKAVTDIGSGAAIGSVFGPWGAALGAALGGAIDLFTSQGPSDGEKWAKGFTSTLPDEISKGVRAGLQKGADSAPRIPGAPPSTAPGSKLGAVGPNEDQTKVLAQQLTAFTDFATGQGTKAGKAFVDSWDKVKFPTPMLLTRDMQQAIDDVPASVEKGGPAAVAAWQDSAAQQMLAYASSLEQNGKLPKGSVDDMIASLEQQFPGLIAYLDKAGLDSANAIAQHLNLSDALKNLKTALGDMRTQWGDTEISTKITNENIYSNTAKSMSDLRLLMKSTNATIRAEATAEYDKLRDDTNSAFTSMVGQTDTSMGKMSALIQGGSKSAAAAAAGNMANVQNAVYSAMNSGVLSTGEGAALIGKALNAELKAFGAKQIPIVSVTGSQLPLPKVFTPTSGSPRGVAAGGGWIGSPGERGMDTVPIMVGAGEAVLNHHQQAPVDYALHATFGMGLGDLFGAVTQPHYMARGGFAGGGVVTASDFVAGPHTASGRTFIPGYAELSNPPSSLNFSALGHLPMGTVLPVTFGGRTIDIPKIDVGAGGAGLDGHVRAIDLSMEAAAMLPGFPGLANVVIGPTRGVSIGAGGSGSGPGAASTITAPGVKGTSTAADLTRAGLGALATAANAYANAHQPATGASAGGGGTLPNFKVAPGPVPAPVQRALATARFELGKPYHAPGYGLDAPALDCSGYVSTILNQAGLDPAGYLLTGGLKTWGQSGPGKWITVGVWGADSGPLGHTMIEIDGQFFESGGGPQGPHIDKTWSMPFTTWRHPAGLARGGFAGAKRFAKGGMVGKSTDGPDAGYVGRPGHQLTQKAYSALMRKRGAPESTIGKFARGGFAGMRQRFAAGGPAVAHAAASHPKPPAQPKHPKVPKVHVPRTISDSLKRLLPSDVVHYDTIAGRYATKQATLATADDQLTYVQGLAPYPAQPLVTLSDADVQVMDPTGSIGYEVGDEVVNQSGMIAGRFFGPAGVSGGTFIPGIDQREKQIQDQLSNLYGQSGALHSAGLNYSNATNSELSARQQRDQRRKRVLAFLRLQVAKAKAIQAELQAITTGNLKQNVAKALSRQAIGKRLSELRSNKLTVSGELAAERQSQAKLLPIERDPTHANALVAQLQGITDAISVESQLSSSGAAGVAVKASKSALLKNSLTNRLKGYANVDRELGGSPYTVGTGGIAGLLQRQMDAIDSSRVTDLSNKAALAPTMQSVANAIAAYITEKNGLPGTKAIQVRPGPGDTSAQEQALLQLKDTQLQTADTALAISQSQFGVLQGFAPLLAGRILGSLQTGISSVPQTGPYLLHKGETVIPDPGGPQGNRATVQTAGGPITIEITFANNDTPLVKLVDARMNQKALQIVSDHSGQRARLIAGVRR